MNVFYYDADRRELVRAIEGTPIRDANTIRTMVGVALAFDSDGYVVGGLTDTCQFQPFPPGVSGRRHISQYGAQIPLREKPDQLSDFPEPEEIAGVDVPLYFGAGHFLGRARVRLLRTVTGKVISVWKRTRFQFDRRIVQTWRKCVSTRSDWGIEENGEKYGVPGQPVVVDFRDVPTLLFTFVKHLEETT